MNLGKALNKEPTLDDVAKLADSAYGDARTALQIALFALSVSIISIITVIIG